MRRIKPAHLTIVFIVMCLLIILSMMIHMTQKSHKQSKKIVAIKSYKVVNVPFVEAQAFLAKETNSSVILYGRNVHKKLSPASLTKVMTAVLAVESGKLNDIVTITKEATLVEPFKMGAKVGDKFLMRDLLIATMVSSSNDAAMAIALHLSGSNGRFANMMNAKAKELGMSNTHFTNPCGFDTGENVSTAYDLMLLTQHAIQSEDINTIANYRRTVVSNTAKTKHYKIKTHNKLLEYNSMAIGLKTGYTAKAGPCLIARAKDGGKDAILIILHSDRGARWKISKKYFDLILKQ
jgi:D-alanyl-D-alanine carboxypeptidase (penicillin-binding protein 5/6)